MMLNFKNAKRKKRVCGFSPPELSLPIRLVIRKAGHLGWRDRGPF
jgi:hypothetical protein